MIKFDVLTYCSGYEYKIYDRFCGSLNDTGFTRIIYIVINKCDSNVISLIKNKYNNVIEIYDCIPKNTHINCHRFLCFKELLEQKILTSEYILLCDSRDVLFQKNPEKYNFDTNIDIYGFTEKLKIKEDIYFNTQWIKQLDNILKINIYDKINDQHIICCGTTFGKKNAIYQYIDKMWNIIYTYNIYTNLDQGIHNYILYMNILNLNIKLLSNDDNFVNTIGTGIKLLNNQNQIININNDVSYIVHQYDRMDKDKLIKLSNKYDFT